MQLVTLITQEFSHGHYTPAVCFISRTLFKPVSVGFSRDHLSSDGGSILLKAIDQKLGITHLVADTFIVFRQPERIRHNIFDLTRQRILLLLFPWGEACSISSSAPIFYEGHRCRTWIIVFLSGKLSLYNVMTEKALVFRLHE